MIINIYLYIYIYIYYIFLSGVGGGRGFRRTKCPVVAQTQGYHLICIWGILVKFQGGGVVVNTVLCARVQIC